MSQEEKICQNCDQQFVIEPDDFVFYEKFKVPPPGLCPDCRMKRKLVWRNERTLYNRTCDLCKRPVITMFHPKAPYVVYCQDCYASDAWDPYAFGVLYDKKRPFLEQLHGLIHKTPNQAVYTNVGTNVNSEYQNFAGYNKNCYLVFNSGNSEECRYSRGLRHCEETTDCYFAIKSENCYECINAEGSYSVRWGQNVVGCLDSWFLLNCRNCQNCFGCVNLYNKKYHFFNEPVSKEAYKKRIAEIRGSYTKIQESGKKFEQLSLQFPRRQDNNIKSVNSEGDYIFESKNCKQCFEATQCEDCKFGFAIKATKDSYDCVGYGYSSELLLETVAVGYSYNVIASWGGRALRNVEYSLKLEDCENCFGCDGLRNAQYCILNRQYSKDEYEKLRKHIIDELIQRGQYGIFFPPSMSFFAYNETLAQENYPLSKKEAIAQGFRWEDDIPRTRDQETMSLEQIPDHIKDVDDSILQGVLKCVSCGYNYRLIRSELEFYRKMLIPVPRKCFNCRHLDRLRRRGPLKLYARTCDKCGTAIQTIYDPERKEIVYCEKCYQQEVV
ncbi:hypothetical protein MYX06_00065 [Patescibacteria group bacterium AH-259-L05]|nr:hypothetical protein [Patescibacteria group bacterium AH-259-L05]